MENKLHPDQFAMLFQRYLENRSSSADTEQLFLLMDESGYRQLIIDLIEGHLERDGEEVVIEDDQLRSRLRIRLEEILPKKKVSLLYRIRWAAAAAVIILLAGTGYFLYLQPDRANTDSMIARDIQAPVRNKATITLSDGSLIVLDSVKNGTLIAGVARKTADGELVIEGGPTSIAYLTAHNPRNSQALHIQLPDKTDVWLNAESDLQYPTKFDGKERAVTLKGEGYFEVVHNAKQPFRVQAGEQLVEDVGTSFNIKAYSGEDGVKTTLLEGEVIINKMFSLKPGQQYAKGKVIAANTEEVMAWKNGSFYLDQRELGEVAQELSRWYDVEIRFQNNSSKRHIVFGGKMGRDLSLQELISVLGKMDIKCRLEGRQLFVE